SFPDLIWPNYLRDLQNLGSIGLHVGERYCAVRRTKINSKTEALAHGFKSLCLQPYESVSGRDSIDLGPSSMSFIQQANVGSATDARSSPAYLISTSAGAIVGSRSVSNRTRCGSLIESAFQPRWTRVPVNGPAPLILLIRRYSSAW